jgi:hypothetical protein
MPARPVARSVIVIGSGVVVSGVEVGPGEVDGPPVGVVVGVVGVVGEVGDPEVGGVLGEPTPPVPSPPISSLAR